MSTLNQSISSDVSFASPKASVGGCKIGIIGNHKNYTTGGVYSKVIEHCGIEAIPVQELSQKPIGAMVWMNGVYGDGWGWTKKQVDEDITFLKNTWPDVRILGNPEFQDDKKVVEQNFEKAFGYPLSVDPKAYTGKAVKKSRVQARHDGQVIECPISDVDDMYSYQVLIDNEAGDFVCDIRAVIVGGAIPYCYIKYRPLEARFSNVNSKVFVVAPRDVLSGKEIRTTLDYANISNLEFGEIDILRDRPTRKIYIVDANNTPSGPPNGLSADDANTAIRLLSNSLLETFNL